MRIIDTNQLSRVTGGFQLGPLNVNAPFTFAPGGSPTVNVNSGDAKGGTVNVGTQERCP